MAGKIEPGETGWQAALREIREETSLVPGRFYSADYCEQFYMTEPEQVAIVPVFVGYVGPDQPVVLNREHSEYRWTTFGEAQTLVPFGGQRTMFEFVRREFVERRPNELLRIEVAAVVPADKVLGERVMRHDENPNGQVSNLPLPRPDSGLAAPDLTMTLANQEGIRDRDCKPCIGGERQPEADPEPRDR